MKYQLRILCCALILSHGNGKGKSGAVFADARGDSERRFRQVVLYTSHYPEHSEREYFVPALNANFGTKLQNGAEHHLNLFFPPVELGDTLCIKPPSYNGDDDDGDGDGDSEQGNNNDNGGRSRKLLHPKQQHQQQNQKLRSQLRRRKLHSGHEQNTNTLHENLDIGLIVKRGGCSFQQKALNAMAYNDIQVRNRKKNLAESNDKNNITLSAEDLGPEIKYMIVHNVEAGSAVTMDPSNEAGIAVNLLMMSIGKRSSQYLLGDIDINIHNTLGGYENDARLNPNSFDPNSPDFDKWSYPIVIGSYELQSTMHLPWKWTYIVIALALSIPILRTFYMFCMMYYRCGWRRNQRGRVTGFRVERRPDPLAMAIDRDDDDDGGGGGGIRRSLFPIKTNDTLTKEQVESLPLIEYNVTDLEKEVKKYFNLKSDHDDKNDHDDDDDNDGDEDKWTGDKYSPLNSSSSSSSNSSSTDEDTILPTIPGQEENSPAVTAEICEKKDFIQIAYSSCESCPVCICDFEEGEKIRLLPRCGHLFHHKCLVPWLTVRKNTCPLCQMVVLEEQENVDNNSQNHDTRDESNTLVFMDGIRQFQRERERVN